MTRETLKRAAYLNRELKMWERELELLRKSSTVRSSLPGTTTEINEFDPTADIAKRRVEVEERIREMKDRIQAEHCEVMKFIAEIPDSLVRMIVYCRCVKLMTWRRIAFEVGGGNTENGVRMIYSRFVDKIE